MKFADDAVQEDAEVYPQTDDVWGWLEEGQETSLLYYEHRWVGRCRYLQHSKIENYVIIMRNVILNK